MPDQTPTQRTDADRNWRRFVLFRVLFNSRFYYPVLAIMFIDLGLSAAQYTLLNFAWAIAIVFSDLPAGVLADRIGRKPLVVGASICMVIEMIFLRVAPIHGGMLLFLCCLANRVLSGMAEGMASGADEALVFDSLAERGRSEEWPLVLDQVMRWQGVGMVFTMLIGGAVYDPVFVGKFLAFLGINLHLTQTSTVRFPIDLTLFTALLTLAIAISLREPAQRESHVVPANGAGRGAESTAWHLVANAGAWIAKTPVAVFVIVAGLLLDSVIRLFLTLSSSYFRVIHIPEALFGVIGALMSGLGLIVSPIARRMVGKNSVTRNYLILGAVVLLSLIGTACHWAGWGILFVFPLMGSIMAVGFMASYYLNALVDSGHRATVLSFKGVAFNLGYGFVSLVFALVLRAVRDGGSADDAVARSLVYLPVWVLFGALLCAIYFRRYRNLAVPQKTPDPVP